MIERRAKAVTLRASEQREGQPRTIRGLGAVYYRAGDAGTQYELWPGMVERILPGAFAGVEKQARDVLSLFNHDMSRILGRTGNGTLELRDTEEGLEYEVEPNMGTADGPQVLALLDRADLRGSSFGFSVLEGGDELHTEGDLTVREIRSVELFDVGPVSEPAYLGTTAEGRELRHRVGDYLERQGRAAADLARAHRQRELLLAQVEWELAGGA